MECLVRKTDTWMDLPQNKKIIEELCTDPIFASKYERRERAGDIIETRPDGYWSSPITGKGYNQSVFQLVCIPGINIAGLSGPLVTLDSGQYVRVKKRGFSVDISGIVDGTALSNIEFLSRLTQKEVEPIG